MKSKIKKIRGHKPFKLPICQHKSYSRAPIYINPDFNDDFDIVCVNDCFWQKKKIQIGQNNEYIDYYLENLREIAQIEGLPEPEVGGPHWLRDNFLLLSNNTYLVPPPMIVIRAGLSGLIEVEDIFKGLTDSGDRSFGIMGNGGAFSLRLKRHENIHVAPFYFEGGNLLQSTDVFGKPIFFCGASNLLLSLLNSKNLISHKVLKEAWKYILDNSSYFENNKSEIDRIILRLEKAGFLNRFNASEFEYIGQLVHTLIIHYKIEMQTVLKGPVHVIGDVFELQPEFHLDMFMLPVPGVVFLQDYNLSIEVLHKIRDFYGDKLSFEGHAELDLYLKGAIEMQEERGASLEKIKSQLENYHLKVVLVPGVFHQDDAIKVNFFNAIVGKGEDSFYCISNGSSGPIDYYLRDMFAKYLNKHGIKNVYFTGRSTEVNEHNEYPLNQFSGSDVCFKRGGGIHCRTQDNSINRGEIDLSLFDSGELVDRYPRHYIEPMSISFVRFLRNAVDDLYQNMHKYLPYPS